MEPSNDGRTSDAGDAPSEFFMVLTPDDVARRRISQSALFHYIMAVEREIDGYLRGLSDKPSAHLQIAFALLPGGKKLLEIQTYPESLGTQPLE